jgi:HSP20 family protein
MLPNTQRNGSSAVTRFAGPLNRLENVFEQVFGEEGVFAAPTGSTFAGPPMAMWADDDHIEIEAELPGVAESDVDLTVHKGLLTIRFERKPSEGRRYLYASRVFGRFERTVSLPEAVDAENVQAELKDGLLRIRLPKSPEAKPRKITLRTS